MPSPPRLFAFALLFTAVVGSPAAAQSPQTNVSAPVGNVTPRAAAATAAIAPGNRAAPASASAPIPAAAPSALEPQGYSYDPQGRRDPFLSLLRRGSDVQRTPGTNRPNGLAGLEASEVTLKGTIASQGTYVGILQGSDNKTYIVRAGDKLLGGTIRVISPDSMVIAQQVTDPLSLEKQREVRKVLRQTEEGK